MISIEKAILADICLGIPLGKLAFNLPDDFDESELASAPASYLFRADQLAHLKSGYLLGHEPAKQAVLELIMLAENALSAGPFSVTDKPNSRFSSDPHDYQSLSKYFWPADAEADAGQVRKDGEVNPECYDDDFDYLRLVEFSETVVLLSLAAYLADEDRFAQRAKLLLQTWFLNSSTKQNPRFTHGQVVPGGTTIRWQATIESRNLIYVTEAILLLEHIEALDDRDSTELRRWFKELLNWLTHSAHGKGSANSKNNIGLWYDLQCLVFAQFCGEEKRVQDLLATLPTRISQQVAFDGSLPHEMRRAHPHDYVAFSLAAMVLLSRASEQKDLHVWTPKQGDGRNFQIAHDWLLRATNARQLIDAWLGDKQATSDQFFDHGFLLDIGVQLRIFAHIAANGESEIARLNETLKSSEEKIVALNSERHSQRKLRERHDKLIEEFQKLSEKESRQSRKIEKMVGSLSWRITKPLRELKKLLGSSGN